jgi:alpha-L-rhamnosidase
MKKLKPYVILCIFIFCISARALAFDALAVSHLRCEMLENPIGIDITSPRFSWQASTEERGMKQAAYQIIVASSKTLLEKGEGDLWNSGKVSSDRSHLVSYAGKPLKSRQQCFWKVKVWTNRGEPGWSNAASFSIGLLNPTDWKAHWIGLDRAFPWDSVRMFARLSARYFRKEATMPKQVKSAALYISGLGLYEVYINGQKIGDQVLAPAPTDYSKTVLYNTFDVTDKVKQGRNAIATVLGNGRFFAMRQNNKPHKRHTFGFPKNHQQHEV